MKTWSDREKLADDALFEIHKAFVRAIGLNPDAADIAQRGPRFIFYRKAWQQLIQDIECTVDHVVLVAKYLRREIAAGNRHQGALKLDNFLQPKQFDADLALATAAAPRARRPATVHATQQVDNVSRTIEIPNPSADPIPVAEALADLDALKRQLKGGSNAL